MTSLCGLAVLGVAAAAALVGSTAAPATGAAVRTVTVSLSDVGRGRWKTSGENDQGSLAINYRWSGSFKFRIPTTVLARPGKVKFAARSTGTLTGNWVGDFQGRRTGSAVSGPYHCEYKGVDVKTRVAAELRDGAGGKLLLTLAAIPVEQGVRFFPGKGSGATISCANAISDDSVAHFNPEWLFREMFSDRGRMSSNTAFIGLPGDLLPRGTVKTQFPREIGEVDSPLRANISWNNVGNLTAKAR